MRCSFPLAVTITILASTRGKALAVRPRHPVQPAFTTLRFYPSRAALAAAFRRVLAAGISLEGAADHGVSESIYLRDPDDNGVELYCDKPKELWPRDSHGKPAMFTHHLDLRDLLSEAPPDLALSTGPEDL